MVVTEPSYALSVASLLRESAAGLYALLRAVDSWTCRTMRLVEETHSAQIGSGPGLPSSFHFFLSCTKYAPLTSFTPSVYPFSSAWCRAAWRYSGWRFRYDWNVPLSRQLQPTHYLQMKNSQDERPIDGRFCLAQTQQTSLGRPVVLLRKKYGIRVQSGLIPGMFGINHQFDPGRQLSTPIAYPPCSK